MISGRHATLEASTDPSCLMLTVLGGRAEFERRDAAR
jgi:hypothetical protein